jgi:hypothetical protein
MPLPNELLEELSVKYAAANERANRDKVRDLTLTALACVAWSALGLFLLAWSFHTTNMTHGKIAFVLGIGLGNAGILFTLTSAYKRGEKRGDW